MRTPGGTSTRTPNSLYTYTEPQAQESSTFLPRSGTVLAEGVQWVSGGPDEQRLGGTAYAPWIVSVEPGVEPPTIGDSYYLAPGSTVAPSGISGRVSEVAYQVDGSSRLTVEAAALEDSFASSEISFADGPTVTGAGAQQGRDVVADIARQISFQGLGPNVFNCNDEFGRSISFEGEVGLRFEKFNRVFDFVQGASPYLSAFVTGQVVTYGKVKVESAVTCKIRPSWQNANRKVIPLGTTGATFSFGPTATFKISGDGTVSFEQKTRFMYGLEKIDGRDIRPINIAKQTAIQAEGSMTATVEIAAGLSVQAGILDRVGVEFKAQLYAEGKLAAKSRPLRVCVELALGFKLGLNAFLDLWVVRWESRALEVKVEFTAYNSCGDEPDPLSPSTDPLIATATLPDGRVGEAYDVWLMVTDERAGTWQIVSGELPLVCPWGAAASSPGPPPRGSESTASP